MENKIIPISKFKYIENPFAHVYPYFNNINQDQRCFLKLLVSKLIETLIEKKIKLDTVCLVARGSSGIFIASYIISTTKISRIYHVLKENTDAHHNNASQIFDKKLFYIFVDDFISSGRTYRECKETVEKVLNSKISAIFIIGSEAGRTKQSFRRIVEEKDIKWAITGDRIDILKVNPKTK